MFVVALVACFSVLSGYFTVLIYEYAAAGLEKSSQTAATRLLNLCFQVCICATLCTLYFMTELINCLTIEDYRYAVINK